jgi:predicted nucleic acid-binding protein
MNLLDTSALAKLLIEEDESAALRAEMSMRSAQGQRFAISTIAVTELRRLALRVEIAPERAEAVVHAFRVLRLNEGILQLAGRIPHRHLGTLDAIHIATALTGEARTLITYDLRQAEAAAGEGLQVARPGS